MKCLSGTEYRKVILLGFVHYNPEIINAHREGVSPYDFSQTAVDEIKKIKEKLG